MINKLSWVTHSSFALWNDIPDHKFQEALPDWFLLYFLRFVYLDNTVNHCIKNCTVSQYGLESLYMKPMISFHTVWNCKLSVRLFVLYLRQRLGGLSETEKAYCPCRCFGDVWSLSDHHTVLFDLIDTGRIHYSSLCIVELNNLWFQCQVIRQGIHKSINPPSVFRIL